MKIYVIEKETITSSDIFEYDVYDRQICEEAGAFDDFDTAFNTIFSLIKKECDEYLDSESVTEISEPTVDDDKHVEFEVTDRYGDDYISITYCVVELELNRKEG